jgi:phosphoserine aminotransferase
MSAKIYFTPGPSQLYPTFKRHLEEALEQDVPSISHRGTAFQEIYKHTVNALKEVLGLPDNYKVFFLGSATEAFERIIKNLSDTNSFHFVQGSFSKRFYEYSLAAGRDAKSLEAPYGEGHDISQANIPPATELVCFTHNETSSGVATPLENIYAVRRQLPEAIIAVDGVSSLPHPAIDYSKIDTAFFSVQKCFGLPAGLGVWLVNDRALEKARQLQAKGHRLGPHHELPELELKGDAYQTPATPNVLYLYLLGKICEDMLQTGLDIVRKDIDTKSTLIYDFIKNSKSFDIAVQNPSLRSKTVIVANTKKPASEINKALAPHGFVIASGYGLYKNSQIRIANFPAHDIASVKALIEHMQ